MTDPENAVTICDEKGLPRSPEYLKLCAKLSRVNVERLRAELVPVAYTKDRVPVRVGMRLHKVWQGQLKSGCAFFMVDMGGLYLDVTAAFSSEQAAMAEDKE